MAYNTITPLRQKLYTVHNNNFVKPKEDEESSHLPQPAEEQTEAEQSPKLTLDEQKRVFPEQAEKNQASINSLKNAVNIAQILKDFRSTALAIGTPPDLNQEVETYLLLVDTQVRKENPNIKTIKSNLKNASALLDGYITETLQRPSNVVENWLDALFLQQVDFKFNENDVNPQFLVQFPDSVKTSQTENTQQTEETSQTEEKTNQSVIIPQDAQLKSLFIQAKKLAYAGEAKRALETFEQARIRAIEVKDSETESKVLYEIGQIYDSKDFLAQALTSYHKSLGAATDLNIKTKAHFSMAKIYDDVAQFEPAINHYMSSISFAGQNDNFAAQSTSLTKIGNIFTDKYDKKAFEFYDEAKTIADESKTPKIKGYVSGNTAGAYAKFNNPKLALQNYSEAVQEYQNAKSPEQAAINYKKAAQLMIKLQNFNKAKSLLQKALANAKQTNNTELISKINSQLQTL
ncbi:MAG TPA: hypothetical protein PKI94_02370 [Candidatus Gastranaerophilaceae bacterium]|nr:hypothetical protein [Candidatus Gastranaerophilaceae bacterium]